MAGAKRKRYSVNNTAESKPVDAAGAPSPQPSLEKLPLQALRRYRKRYQLPVKVPSTIDGYMLGGSVGRQSWSANNIDRSAPADVASAVKMHFDTDSIREGDAIAEFVYAVQHKDEVFKLDFGGLAEQ